MTEEHRRLEANRVGTAAWLAWGPYLSERQWGTVREDYSAGGDAWDYFSHEQSRSRAYRWGEDGIAGISDDRQRLCFSVALWNGVDPILKERMFGLTNGEGNHGEDAKEYWFYLDSTPTHSYLKALYKYPQGEFPYNDLVATNGRRGRDEFEYELIDTGIFAEDRYFDVFVEYAKAAPDDILVELTVHNRGPDQATLDLLPTLWFRNTWAWSPEGVAPSLERAGAGEVRIAHHELGEWVLSCESSAELLFCENETNNARLFGTPNVAQYVKDGINDYVVGGVEGAVNPEGRGTKVAARHKLTLEPGASTRVRVRLTAASARAKNPLGAGFDRVLKARRKEADEFYATVIDPSLDADSANVMRQALAGLLWGKQYYEYDVHAWLREHGVNPWSADGRAAGLRNTSWYHLDAGDVISMPDKWEYPWFAAWDLALQTVPLSLVDVDFAKGQMELLLGDRYLHPSGQIPAYEWNFSDVNPPLHAWAALFLYERERTIRGAGDPEFLERVFDRLLINFTWWVNRKDPDGNNLFQGGFLGLDNIGVFDRSAPLPGGGTLDQADGTAWMALYCQAMLQMALELTKHDPAYADMAVKFGMHFVWIAAAMSPPDGERDVGRGGRLLLRRDAVAGRQHAAVAGALAGRPAAAVRGDRDRARGARACPRAPSDVGGVRRQLQGFDPGARATARCGRARQALDVARRGAPAAADPGDHAGRGGVPRAVRDSRHLALPRRAPVRVRHRRAAVPRGLRAGGVEHRHVRRELELARAGVVSDEHRDPARAAPAARVLRRRAEGGVPDGLRRRDEPARGRRGDRSPADLDLRARPGRAAARVRRDRGVPVRPALARPAAVPRVLPRRQRGRPRRQPPDGLDRARRAAARAADRADDRSRAPRRGGLIDMRLPARPTIYEINTAVWLGELGCDLATVPAREWDRLAALRVDAVWLMGVWQRSPAGLEIAHHNPGLMSSFRQALPDLHADDVIGSAYCVRGYELEPRFGDPRSLATARDELAQRGLGLILDYVPNHVAPDHPWTTEHPDYFIRETDGTLANGKDPYFAPWPDVVQLNAFSPGLRAAVIDTLIAIAAQCDGVRCDMAMLMDNAVFARTWGARAGDPPEEDYWPAIISAVHATEPAFVFIAEAYWDMEWTLQQQGFDYCYDKRLYDRVVSGPAQSVRGHLQGAAAYQERLLRFIENHDEPRAADTFTPERQRAAAVAMSTLQGARMYHAGQLEGLHTHIPVFLARGPDQPADEALRAFYDTLLRAVADSNLRDGEWQLCECGGWPDNHSAEQLVAWCWRTNGQRHLVIVNLADQEGQAQVRLPWSDLAGRTWRLRNALDGEAFERDGDELQDSGLYVAMSPWEPYFLELA